MSTSKIMYKLLSQDMTSHGDMTWEIGQENVATGEGTSLCTDGVLHCYSDPRLAVILNPIHANIRNPRLFEIEVDEIVSSDGLKFGSKKQKPLRELELPVITLEQKISFAINCALEVYNEPKFVLWAKNWLEGKERSTSAAADADADAAADDAAAAAYAARAAADADARATARAAYAADAAAYAAAYAESKLNLIELLNKSL